jgi:hypothetical protein
MRDERSTLSPKLSRFSRLGLAHLPTPLKPIVTEHLGGPKLWVKREDATGTSDLAVQSADSSAPTSGGPMSPWRPRSRDDILVQSNFLLELKARLWGGAAALPRAEGAAVLSDQALRKRAVKYGVRLMTRDVMEPSDPRDTGRKPILA